MNPRQARRERREAERKAKKLELKKSHLSNAHPSAVTETNPEASTRRNPEPAVQPIAACSAAQTSSTEFAKPPGLALPTTHSKAAGFVSQTKPSRAGSNRANAQLSTGPRTPEGKLASSRNSTKHGLASGQLIIPGENPATFDALLQSLNEEHQPATITEELLIQELAQSYWLTQRAIRLQNTCFTEEGVDQKQLALFLRYHTTHERAFHKALAALLKLKKSGFVSQRTAKPSVGNTHKLIATADQQLSLQEECPKEQGAGVPPTAVHLRRREEGVGCSAA